MSLKCPKCGASLQLTMTLTAQANSQPAVVPPSLPRAAAPDDLFELLRQVDPDSEVL